MKKIDKLIEKWGQDAHNFHSNDFGEASGDAWDAVEKAYRAGFLKAREMALKLMVDVEQSEGFSWEDMAWKYFDKLEVLGEEDYDER